MDNSTEYCSFVSIDYIICECGDTFPNEDALRDHLEVEHLSKHEKDQPADRCLQDASQNETVQMLLPEEIKEENIIVQYIDQDGYTVDADEVTKNEGQSEEEVEEKPPEPFSPYACKQVVFKKEQIEDDVVILAHENDEHDYDREAIKTEQHEYFFCEVCGKSFMSEKAVNMHMRVHMTGTIARKPKNSVCDICGKKYAMWHRVCCGVKRPASQKSKRAAKKKVIYTCDICGVGRCSNAALRYHQRVHTGERPYKCNICQKTFTMPLFLQLHIRIHTGERPYQCPSCPKAFSNQAALVRHSRVHTGIKPYSCPECFKSFTQSNSMKLHFQTVHLKMPAPYKSAARRLRDQQKVSSTKQVIVVKDPMKHKKVWETAQGVPLEKLIIRHRLYDQPEIEFIDQSNSMMYEEYDVYDESSQSP